MQHHPGSWYIPWGVPLQKMLAVPFNPAAAAAGYHQPPQIAAAAVQQAQAPPPPTHTQSQQQQYTHHHQLHQAMHHNHAAAALHQQLHPAAAAAMFTPLTLRSFVAHPHLNMSQQPMSAAQQPQQAITNQTSSQLTALNQLTNVGVVPVRQTATPNNTTGLILPMRKVIALHLNDTKHTHTHTHNR